MVQDLIELEQLYRQIQELCFRKLSQAKYEKEAAKTYSNILNTCFNLLKKETFRQNFQKDEDGDYQSQLFEDGYKQGYAQINCDRETLEILLYNSRARFDIWQPNQNPYAKLQDQNKTTTNNIISYANTLSTFKRIIKILKQKQDTDEFPEEIINLLPKKINYN